MGTTIKINAWIGRNTTKEQWLKVQDYFINKFDEADFEGDFITSGTIYCRYSDAYLKNQLEEDFLRSLKGSGVEFGLYYLEVEPDEVYKCEEVEK